MSNLVPGLRPLLLESLPSSLVSNRLVSVPFQYPSPTPVPPRHPDPGFPVHLRGPEPGRRPSSGPFKRLVRTGYDLTRRPFTQTTGPVLLRPPTFLTPLTPRSQVPPLSLSDLNCRWLQSLWRTFPSTVLDH